MPNLYPKGVKVNLGRVSEMREGKRPFYQPIKYPSMSPYTIAILSNPPTPNH